MVYGSAAVMPTSNNEITEADEGTHGGVTTSLPRVAQPTALLSVQSDPSILSKPKPQKHRRYNSMFSIFSNDHSSSPATEPRSPSSSTLKKTSSGITSGRLKWDWKLGDLWHGSRSGKLEVPKPDPLESASSVDSGSEKSVAVASEGGGNGSLHYTSLGIFQSSKYSGSDLKKKTKLQPATCNHQSDLETSDKNGRFTA
jgi:hypothetical protein